MILALAGLPGTGKSALAAELARLVPALVLDKDRVRAALLPERPGGHSGEDNDFVFEVMLEAARRMIHGRMAAHVILDGRTFTRAAQVEATLAFCREASLCCQFVECVCSAQEARRRLAEDRRLKRHPASDRTPGLHDRLRAVKELLPCPALRIDTGATKPFEAARFIAGYLRQTQR